MSLLFQIILASMVAISIVLVILMIVFWKKRKPKEGKGVDYQSFFVMGISFVGLGIVFTATINPGFLGITVLGVIYIILGWKNKDKWKKKK